MSLDPEKARGGDFYTTLASGMTSSGRPAASQALSEMGIPGTKYLDQLSRNNREGGTSNYVIFDPRMIEITDRFAQGGRIAKAGAGKVIGEGIDYLTKMFSGSDAVTDALRLAERERLLQASGPEYSRTYEDLAKKGLTQSGYASKLKSGKPVEEYSTKLRTKGTLQPWQETDVEKLVREGASIYPALGDRSAANQFVTEIGGVPLTSPVNLQAGGDFGRSEFGVGENAAFWASRQGAASKMINRLINDQLREEGPSYMTHVAMGYPNLDSTHMVRQGVVRAIPNMNISSKDLGLFNETVRKNYPEFPGVENTEEAEAFLNSIPGSSAADIVSSIERDKFIKRGFPSLLETRWAVSEPRLMDVPPLTTGYSIGQVGTKGAVPPRALAHETYGKQIPLVGEVSGLKNSVPASVMFPEWWAGLKPHVQADSTKAQHLMMMQFPRQKATQQWLDNLRAYQEAHKDVYGYNQGGRADIEAAMHIARQHKAGGGGVATVKSYQEPKESSIYGELPELPYDQEKSFNTGEQVRSLYNAYMPNVVKPYVDAMATVAGNPAAFNPMGQVVTEARGAAPEVTPYTGGDFGSTFMDFTAGPMVNVGVNTTTGRPSQTEDYIDTALNLGGGALLAKGLPYVKPAIDAGYRGVKAMLPAAAGTAALTVGSEDAEAAGAGLFSKAMKVIRELPMNKMEGPQALAMLGKAGVGADELKWTGLTDALASQGTVTKDDIMNLVRQNDVQLGETIFQNKTNYPYQGDEWPRAINAAELRDDWDEAARLNEAWEASEGFGGAGAPKFQKWSLPGGSKYQETLITYEPNKEEYAKSLIDPAVWHRMTDEQKQEFMSYPSKMFSSGHWNEPNVVAHIRTQEFPIPNPEGGTPLRAFNLDELQSDWAQAGRKSGFKNKKALDEWNAKYDANTERLKLIRDALSSRGDDLGFKEPEFNSAQERMRWERSPEYQEFYRNRQDALNNDPYATELKAQQQEAFKLQDELIDTQVKSGDVSIAPYVQSTNQWTDLGLKKGLSQALDRNADMFTWTPGDVQAERFDLSKQIAEVKYDHLNNDLYAYDLNGREVINQYTEPQQLDEYIGKELAEKVRNEVKGKQSIFDEYGIEKDPETGKWYPHLYGDQLHEYGGSPVEFSSKYDAEQYIKEMIENDADYANVSLSGLDLKVGGEGMKDFYNNIIPKRLSEVIRKATGQKPQFETFTVQTSDGPQQVQGIRLTPELKAKLQSIKETEGGYFPHFANGGKVDDSSINKALQIAAEASV